MKLLEYLHITLCLPDGKKNVRTSIVWDEDSKRYTDRRTEGISEDDKEEYSEIDYYEDEMSDSWSLAIVSDFLYDIQFLKGYRLLRKCVAPLTVWSNNEEDDEPIASDLIAEVEVEKVETVYRGPIPS